MKTKKSNKKVKGDDSGSSPSEIPLQVEIPKEPTSNVSTADALRDEFQESKNVAVLMDKEFVEDIYNSSTIFEDESLRVNQLSIMGTTENQIIDDDGTLFDYVVYLADLLSNLRTLALTGHVFKNVSLTEDSLINLSNLVIELCTLSQLSIENDACPGIESLLLRRVESLSKLSIGSNAFPKGLELTIMNLKRLTSVVLEDGSYPSGRHFSMTKCGHVQSLSFGQLCFQNANTLQVQAPYLESITFDGKNFQQLVTADFSGCIGLVDLKTGAGCFKETKSLILNNLPSLRTLDMGDENFVSADSLTIKECPKLHELTFGAMAFGAMESANCVIAGIPKLSELTFGAKSFALIQNFFLLKCSKLTWVSVGRGAFQSCRLFVLLNYVNVVNIDDWKGRYDFIPAEDPYLPIETEIHCPPGSFRIEVLPQLTDIHIQQGAFPLITEVGVSFLPKLKELNIDSNCFVDASTLTIQDNAKLTDLTLSDDTFSSIKICMIQNLPSLRTFTVGMNVMIAGQFLVMRNLYPTQIEIDRSSFVTKTACYKSLPGKVSRRVLAGLSPMQRRIASDTFFGMFLMITLFIIGIIGIILFVTVLNPPAKVDPSASVGPEGLSALFSFN